MARVVMHEAGWESLRRRARNHTANIAEDISTDATRMAPILTGYLKASIGVQRRGSDTWRIQASAFYGFYVEYGTSKMRAQPFLRPAAYRVRG